MRFGVAPGPCGRAIVRGRYHEPSHLGQHSAADRRPGALGALAGPRTGRPRRLHRPADPSAIRRKRREVEHYGVKTIGDVTTVGNAEPVPLGGVGLVVGLEGTGGEPAADNYRTDLEDELSREEIKDIKKELANPNHALVVVTALLPPGAVVGDPIDVEVALPPRSGKATSLRGGYLRAVHPLQLRLHQAPQSELRRLQHGAQGPEVRQGRRGRCWWASATATRPPASSTAASGAAAAARRPTRCVLLMNPEYQQARVTSVVADRINAAFRGGPADTPDSSTAVANEQPRRRAARAAGLQAEPAALPARGPADPPGRLARPGRRQGRRRPLLPPEAGRRPARPGPDGDGRPAAGGAGPGEHPGPQGRPGVEPSAGPLLRRRVAGLPRLRGRRRGTGPGRGQAADAAGLRPDGPGVAGRVGFPLPAARPAGDLDRRRDALRRLPRLRAWTNTTRWCRANCSTSRSGCTAWPRRRRRWSTCLDDAAGGDRAVRRGADAEAAVLVPGRRVRGDGHGRRRPTAR